MLADSHAVGPILFPLVQGEAVSFEQVANIPGPPMQELVENGHDDAEGTVA